MPWIWCWKDRGLAVERAAAGRPFVVGPNVLFVHSRRPCGAPGEREICRAASCRTIFTESAWYRELIRRHLGPANLAPIVLWPYPIDPKPGGPLPAEYDLLIYAKGNYSRGVVARLVQRFRRVRVLIYGRFQREELYDAARRSRCCVYLSTDDRGPLALAEILLCGCPTIGVATGAPFVEPGHTGVILDRFDRQACVDAVETCRQLGREAVTAAAAVQFNTGHIVDRILRALQQASWPTSIS